MSADFSMETMQARGIGKKYSVMKNEILQPRLFYSARPSIKIEGEIKSFPDRIKLIVGDHTIPKTLRGGKTS